MPHIIIPLGTLVKIDMKESVKAFQALVDQQKLGVNVSTLLGTLGPIFKKFNTGGLSEAEFKIQVLKFLPLQVSDDQFNNAWNAMCIIDDETIKLIELLRSHQANNIHIYNGTNPIHSNHLKAELEKKGFRPNIYSTFNFKLSKDQLLLKIINDRVKSSDDKRCIVVLGNTDSIEDRTLRDLAQEIGCVSEIERITSTADVMSSKLRGPRLSIGELTQLLTLANPKAVAYQYKAAAAGDNMATAAGTAVQAPDAHNGAEASVGKLAARKD